MAIFGKELELLRNNLITQFLLFAFLLAYSNSLYAQKENRKQMTMLRLGALGRVKETPVLTGAFKTGSGTDISLIHLRRVASTFYLGGGVGISAYVNPTTTTIPIYLSSAYYLRSRVSSPFLFLNAGLALRDKSFHDGEIIEPGIGWAFKIWKSAALTPEIGYRFQSYGRNEENGKISSLLLGIGISF